jgi:hypothetical protein
MKPLRYLIVAAAIGAAFATTIDTARADGVPGPGYPGAGPGYPGGGPGAGNQGPPSTLGQAYLQSHNPPGQHIALFFQNFHRTKLPAFQAAPWYNYWPYDGHFLTPAPINGQFYGPPLTGNFPVNPYFPGPSHVGGFGTMPGGAPPGWPSAVPQGPGR